jgi:tRNA(Ile)-lysidine synthase
LLHATLRASGGSGIQVHALHVHHGLSVHADDWLAHCERQCLRWSKTIAPLGLHFERLDLKPARGESVEALARTTRYAALRRMALALGIDTVLLAHHRRDQADTFLLQALRGAGAAGLAAMPRVVEREGITWLRPWLTQPREAIESYLRQHRLRWVDDDSNADRRFARNRLRLDVWPALKAAFPHAEVVLADAAERSAQAAASAAELAAIDLAACSADDGALTLSAWRALPAHRAAQSLRLWLSQQRAGAAGAGETDALLHAALHGDRPARWAWGSGELRRYRGALRWSATGPGVTSKPVESAHESPAASLCITRAGRHPVPGWAGALVVRRVRSGGVAWSRLASLELRKRDGSDRFQFAADRPARSLKKQYQAVGLATWDRGGPVLLSGGQLIFVPGLGMDARALAAEGELQAMLSWESD